ncbi:hypothetical protein OnM2_080044 [Erysiphe neolycopersici]|uniref:Uncharacterized protein n=1 Tax=Erysiphe neolycopersici TaxID=212602 RepID=A0A420HGP2_9PEZI|nr:hypothetical protein OnM2_080044 [Erysiphe neolycopersici]
MSRSCNSYATKKGQSSGLKRSIRRFCNSLRGCKRSYPNDLAHLHVAELWVESWECHIKESTQKRRRSKKTRLETIPEEQEYDEDMMKI